MLLCCISKLNYILIIHEANRELKSSSLAPSDQVPLSTGAMKLTNLGITVYLIFLPLVALVSIFLFILLLYFCNAIHCLEKHNNMKFILDFIIHNQKYLPS